MKNLFFFLAFLMIGTIASTQTTTSLATKNQINQQIRIKQGVKSGELTKRETVKLQKQQASIQRTKKRAKADGVVTKKERAVINAKQKNASKNIYKQKNDRQSRR